MSKYWFKRRRYGRGWTPITWQGWLSVAAYLVVVLGALLTIIDVPENTFNQEVAIVLLIISLATVSLFQISYRKGPKPKWRWGKKPDDNSAEDF